MRATCSTEHRWPCNPECSTLANHFAKRRFRNDVRRSMAPGTNKATKHAAQCLKCSALKDKSLCKHMADIPHSRPASFE
eukprot:2028406-Amphidinium_carterae.2